MDMGQGMSKIRWTLGLASNSITSEHKFLHRKHRTSFFFFTMPVPCDVSGSHTVFGGSLRLNFTGKLSNCKALLGTPATTIVILVFEALAKIQ